ncbi:MAG: hypothetical protein JKY71_03345 [Alphaproteobacteria bacterium]|nr:hypothetical protein [Alphaproteobacteria bacterium]
MADQQASTSRDDQQEDGVTNPDQATEATGTPTDSAGQEQVEGTVDQQTDQPEERAQATPAQPEPTPPPAQNENRGFFNGSVLPWKWKWNGWPLFEVVDTTRTVRREDQEPHLRISETDLADDPAPEAEPQPSIGPELTNDLANDDAKNILVSVLEKDGPDGQTEETFEALAERVTSIEYDANHDGAGAIVVQVRTGDGPEDVQTERFSLAEIYGEDAANYSVEYINERTNNATQALASFQQGLSHQKFVNDVMENGVPESQYQIIESLVQRAADINEVSIEDVQQISLQQHPEHGTVVQVVAKNADDAENPKVAHVPLHEFLGVDADKEINMNIVGQSITMANMYINGDLKNATENAPGPTVKPEDAADAIATLSNFPNEMAEELGVEIPEADNGKWKDLTGSGHVYIRGAVASALRIHGNAHDAEAAEAAKPTLAFAQKKPEIFVGDNVGEIAALGSRILDAEKDGADLKSALNADELALIAKETDKFAKTLARQAAAEGAPEYFQKYAHEVGVANAHFQYMAKTELKAALEGPKERPSIDDAKQAVNTINDFPKEMASSLGIQVSQDENEGWRDFTGSGHVYVRGTWASLERIHDGAHDAAAAEAALGTLKYAQKAPEKFFGDNAAKVAELGTKILEVEKNGGTVADAVSADDIDFLQAELQNFRSIVMDKAADGNAPSYATPYAGLVDTVSSHYQHFGDELKAEFTAEADAKVKPEDKPKAERYAANLLDKTGIHIGDVTGVEAVELEDGSHGMKVHLNDSAAYAAGQSSRTFRISTDDLAERSKLLNALATGEFKQPLPQLSDTMKGASKLLNSDNLSVDDIEYARVYGDKVKLKVPGEDELREIKIPEGSATFASVFEVANAINELKTRQEAMKARHPGSLHNEEEIARLDRENIRNEHILNTFEDKVAAAKFAQIDSIDGESVVHLYNGKDEFGITQAETVRVPFPTGANARINRTLDGIRAQFDKNSPATVDMDVVLGLTPSNDTGKAAAPKDAPAAALEKLKAKVGQIDPDLVDSVRIPDDPSKGVQQIIITYSDDVDPKAQKLPMRITVPYGLVDADQIDDVLADFKNRLRGYEAADADIGRQCLLALTGNHLENVDSIEMDGDNVLVVGKGDLHYRYKIDMDKIDTDMDLAEITAHIQEALENTAKPDYEIDTPNAANG